MHFKKKGPRINKYIVSSVVKLIDQNGDMLGLINISDALKKANDAHLDLVEVDPNSSPPICKILDYGKVRYEKQKQSYRARKKQNVNAIKEIRLRPNIEENDYSIKIRNVRSFLEEKYRVKISLRFRGREMIYQDNGMEILNKMIKDVEDIGVVESKPMKNNNQLILVLSAK